MTIDDQINDLNIVLFALRSVSGPELTISELISDIEVTKSCMKGLKGISAIYDNYFSRNNLSKEEKNHLTLQMTNNCLEIIRQKTTQYLQLLRPLNYPLPEIFLSKIDLVKDKQLDPNLNFEVNLYNWLRSVIITPMRPELLEELKSKEGFSDLNFQITGTFLGFLTYGTIDEWNYKDIRLNKTIDNILKEWTNAGILQDLGIRCKNEFLTLKNGVILVAKN